MRTVVVVAAAAAFLLCLLAAFVSVAHLATTERERERVGRERDVDGERGREAGEGGMARAERRARRRANARRGEGEGGYGFDDAVMDERDAAAPPMTRKEAKLEMYRQRWEAREMEEMEYAARYGRAEDARAPAEDVEPEVSDETLVRALEQRRISRFDELSARLGFKKPDTIRKRVRALEDSRAISGVVDEHRGRFVRVSPSEMERVASYVLERGRVDVEELTRTTNELLC